MHSPILECAQNVYSNDQRARFLPNSGEKSKSQITATFYGEGCEPMDSLRRGLNCSGLQTGLHGEQNAKLQAAVIFRKEAPLSL